VASTPAAEPVPDHPPQDRQDDPPAAPGRPVPGWVGLLFICLAVVIVPWIVVLWLRLPARDTVSHYRLAWVGFDVLLAVALARTGWTAWRGLDHVELPAVASATLLVVDAWFALLTALLVELPLAAVCVWIAVNAERVRRERLHWALHVDPQRVRR
jgi:hypothetical protein